MDIYLAYLVVDPTIQVETCQVSTWIVGSTVSEMYQVAKFNLASYDS